MAINAYTGLMGSGKSYECVSSVIVAALAKGRRVVTNIDGIDGEAIAAFIHERQGVPVEKIGEVVHCKNSDVSRRDFFPYGEDVDTFVKPGDVVCIDEAWRFWGSDNKICSEHRVFFREHRHYVDPETKVSCDLVLMVQDIGDLNRILKAVVEVSFRTTKLKSLGLSKTYRVEMWEGWKQTRKARVSVQVKRYDKQIFPLYSSYDGGAGKEVQVDDRQNILKSPKLWILAGGLVVLIGASATGIRHFFATPPGSSGASGSTSGPVAAAAVPVKPAVEWSPSWRIAGDAVLPSGRWVVLVSNEGALRYESPSLFSLGVATVGKVDGVKVSRFSGAAPVVRESGPAPMPVSSIVGGGK